MSDAPSLSSSISNSSQISSLSKSVGTESESNKSVLQDVSIAGVVFTCSIENGAPYYHFNFDDSSKSTESVTAGLKADLRTVILSKNDDELLSRVPPELSNVLIAIK